MSDATPKKVGAKGWSENEKLGLLCQIIEKFGTIPWSTIDLPEGRTVKACSVMVDKEKAKLRKAKAEAGEDGAASVTPATASKTKVRASRAKTPPFDLQKAIGKLADPLLAQKRAAFDEATPAASAKKPRAPRKSKAVVKAEADDESVGEAAEEGKEDVTAEAFE